ncbi:DNA-binding phage protein [Catalinimonas alkaloidigena]|uniref:hypothetical protein n=1 Tax=Catalinimonas alkaloidigena TaxID=1075417 RepID=UPI0024072191|nr:hypothetical protein [Catalinimonas alkaloidigena]MDF9801325.1 DNA-binding phage protein [Catalinimonas alkaloidigena]
MKNRYVIRIPYLVAKKMSQDMHQDQKAAEELDEQRVKIVRKIGQKLEEQLSTRNLSANRIAKTTGMKPETLYRIRDGSQLPSCETIIKVKQMIPNLDLNWWLFDQGDSNLQSSEALKAENEYLKTEIEKYRKMVIEISRLIEKSVP